MIANSNKGEPLYLDMVAMLPEHFRSRPDFLKLVEVFQDYLNDGFRYIPNPETKILYKEYIDKCNNTSIQYTEVTEIAEPLNHYVGMENDLLNLEIARFEEYDRNRDISTWAIDKDIMEKYLRDNSDYDTNTIYQNKIVKYSNLKELIDRNTSNVNPLSSYKVFYNTVNHSNILRSDIYNTTMKVLDIKNKFSIFFNKPFKLHLYFCNMSTFKTVVSTTYKFTVEETFYPDYLGQTNYQNISNKIPPFSQDYLNSTDFNSINASDSTDTEIDDYKFRITIDSALNSIANLNTLLTTLDNNIDATVEFTLDINDYSLIPLNTEVVFNIPILAPRLLEIKKYQNPYIFYEYFKDTNDFRIASKNGGILEKINRLITIKDPLAVDYEYISMVAKQLGYDLNVDEEDIFANEYYTSKEEKEQVIRNIIRNLPEYYKIKCTESALEMILLSFGIVGQIIYLYTIGDEHQAGYVDFIDSRIIEHSMYNPFNISDVNKLNNTSILDWYPSPHFKIEFDLLTQNLNLLKSMRNFDIVHKAVKNAKPINTVFQGFIGTMMLNYGDIFINKPLLHLSGYQSLKVEPECIILDTWNSACAFE